MKYGFSIKKFGKASPVLCLAFALTLILSAGGITMFASASTSTAPTFSPAVNLSDDLGNAKNPVISSQGLNVYAAWVEGSKGLFFRMSTDGGNTWTPSLSSPALKLSRSGGSASFPVMFTQYQGVNSGDVYVAWTQGVKQANGSLVSQIFVAVSNNSGLSFKLTQLSHNSTNAQNTPTISAWGSNVYVAWFSAGGGHYVLPGGIDVSSSTNNGTTWSAPLGIVNPSYAGESQIVAYGNSAYLVADGIYYTATYDSGASWSPQINLYNPANTTTSYYVGREPWIAAWGNQVYVTWEANSTTPGVGYHDQSVTSMDGGKTWGAIQNLTDAIKNSWEPENAAYGSSLFETFHVISNQGIYVTEAINVNTESPTGVLQYCLAQPN